MSNGGDDLSALSDRELASLIRDLQLQVAACEARLEPPPAARQRTVKVIRGTLLTVGGLLGATFEPVAAILVVVGLWDWIEMISDDAGAMNHQIRLREELFDLAAKISAAEAELDRRMSAGNQK